MYQENFLLKEVWLSNAFHSPMVSLMIFSGKWNVWVLYLDYGHSVSQQAFI